jgi:hypothetical protein
MNKPFLKKLFPLLCVAAVQLQAQAHEGTDTAAASCSPLLLTAGYRCPLKAGAVSNSGRGLFFEAGFNPGYYFHEPQLTGIFAGWAGKDRAWNTAFSDQFLLDFNSCFSDISLTGPDSAILSAFRNLVNQKESGSTFLPGCQTGTFHNSSLYYGAIVGLPFKKYASCLKIYGGLLRSSYTGTDLTDRHKEYNHFEIRRKMLGLELMLFPGWSRRLKEKAGNAPLFAHLGAFSFYYEHSGLSNASLYFTDGDEQKTIAFPYFMTPAFSEKYRHEHNFGIRLSAGIY